jgi:hypothetical protein
MSKRNNNKIVDKVRNELDKALFALCDCTIVRNPAVKEAHEHIIEALNLLEES